MLRATATTLGPICVLALGCGSASETTPKRAASAAPTVAGSEIRLAARRTPPLRVPRYLTRGTYPAFAGEGVDLREANAAFRDAVRRDQRVYARAARPLLRESPAPKSDFGLYETGVDRTHLSASDVVVSALFQSLALLPGGNDGRGWISATTHVPSGRRISVDDLFADRRGGLRALAAAALKRLPAENRCVREGLREGEYSLRSFHLEGFEPRVSNYDRFALTAAGLVIGFDQGQVADVPCSNIDLTIPYDDVRAQLGDLGRQLVEGVRRPRNGCEIPFDTARWKAITRGANRVDDRFDHERWRLAAQLAECDLVEGRSMDALERTIGRAGVDRSSVDPGEGETWSFRLGDDTLGGGSDRLYVSFDEKGVGERAYAGGR